MFAHIDEDTTTTDSMMRVDVSFVVSGGRTSTVDGLDKQDVFYNYYLGHIPEGRERVQLQNKALAAGLYPNIDAIYGLGDQGLFIHLVCKPGSSPNTVKMEFTGAMAVSVQTDSSLLVQTALEDLVLPRMLSTTVSSGGIETYTAWRPTYSIGMDGKVSINLGTYDTDKTLVIKIGRGRNDDDINEEYWSTYDGGSTKDIVDGLGIDPTSGDIYHTGGTKSNNFPLLNAIIGNLKGEIDAFAGHFNYQGEPKWITLYGGSTPSAHFGISENEYGHDIVFKQGSLINLGSSGDGSSIYFVGHTDALDFPLLDNGLAYFDDDFYQVESGDSYRGFIVKLNSTTGKREWATFFGNPGVESLSPFPQESVNVAKLNSSGNLCIAGIMVPWNFTNFSSSSLFPTTTSGSAYSQVYGSAYVAEFDETDNLTWATRLTCDGSYLGTHSMAFDSEDNLYLVGQSGLGNDCVTSFPVVAENGEYLKNYPTESYLDGWIMKFDNDRQLKWSTLFGGTKSDQISSVIVDKDDNVYVVGSTYSSDLPTMNALGSGAYYDGSFNGTVGDGTGDIFIAKFSSANTQQYTSYFGGTGDESYISSSFLVEAFDGGCAAYDGDNLIVTSTTKSSDLPVYNAVPGNIYYHGSINRGFGSDNEDAFLAIFGPGMERRFCTYWGGDKRDYSHQIEYANANGQSYVVIGGGSTSNSGVFDRRIPLAQETPNSYYQPVYAGGLQDGFISKIRINQVISATHEQVVKRFSVFPNPTGDFVNLILSNENEEKYKVEVLDLMGRMITVPVFKNDTQDWQISLGALPAGQYILKVSCRSFVASQLILKI